MVQDTCVSIIPDLRLNRIKRCEKVQPMSWLLLLISCLFLAAHTKTHSLTHEEVDFICVGEILEKECADLGSNVKTFCRYCCLVVYTQNVGSRYLWSGRGFVTWKPYLAWKRGLLEQLMSTKSLFIQTDYNFGWRRCYVYPRFIRPGTDGSQNCRFVYTYLELKFPKRFLLCNIRVRGTDVRWNCCDLFQILTARKIVVYLGGILTLIDLEPTWN